MSKSFKETYVGFLSYKDHYNRYHVIRLSKYNSDKWTTSKDHFNMAELERRINFKLDSKYEYQSEKDPLTEYEKCNPFNKNGDGGFYFVTDPKIMAEKIYKTVEIPKITSFEPCLIDDLMGCPILIDTKSTLYVSPKLGKIGYKITALHIKNLEPINKN